MGGSQLAFRQEFATFPPPCPISKTHHPGNRLKKSSWRSELKVDRSPSFGLVLAKQCGITDPEIDHTIAKP